MANTYSSLFYHLVFSTKNRKYFLKPDKENRIWDYLSGIARNIGATVAAIVSYIENQREHHSNLSFEDEYRRILSLHDIDEVDHRFLFG